jgi:uncharacterized protein (TIGR02145 family)
MAKYTAPIQPLILTEAGAKPTIPNPATIMPTDSRFNKESDLMIGQLAYNVPDDIWYYRSYSAIKALTQSTVLEVEDVEVWRSDKIYQAGNTFVSYVNTESSDPQFQTPAIYRCITTTSAGESPESAQTKWELQGTTVDNSQISFLDLIDTPTDYTGLSGKFVAINDGEDGLKFVDPPESETITLDTVEVWDDTKAYTAGNTFVSYVNAGSSDPQFQNEAIYRCDVDTTAGESPETNPEKWVYQGTQVELSSGNTSNTAVADLNTLKALTGYKNTDSVFVSSEQAWYKFDSSDDSGTRANDYDDTDNPGSWIKVFTLDNLVETLGYSKEDSLWEPETFSAATTEHPRWDDSGDSNIYGIDNFRFDALPAGTRNSNPSYAGIGEFFGIWSKDKSQFYVDYNSSDFSIFDFTGVETNGMSIRLVRPYVPADGDKIDGRILSGTFSDYDGNTYDGVIIGDQVWSTTNLKTTSYADGTPIPTGYNDTDWSNLTTGAYAVYDHNLVSGIDSEAEMIAAYGLLYNWYAVDNALGLATNGTVPTDAEFMQLTDYIIATYPEIDSTNIGDALKSIRQVNSPYLAESDKYIKPKLDELTGEQRYVKADWIYGIDGQLDYVTPEMFGAVGDGVTDDATSFQNMFDSLSINNPKKVYIPAKVYLINSTVNLTKVDSGSSTLLIEGYGCTLKTNTSSVRIFNRQPIDQSEASVMVSSSIQIKGIKFIGSGLTGQMGLFLGATYGSSINDCYFGSFDTGLRTEFALMTEINNTLLQSCSNRHVDINYGSSWGGSTSNSQSNSTTLRNVRVYSSTGSNSCIYIESCSGIHLDNVICEGGNPLDNIYFNGRNSTVVKEFSCRGLHLENTPSNSHITITSVGGGTYTFKNIFTQYPSKLISNLDSSGIDIIVEDVPWIPSGTTLEGSARWLFKNSAGLAAFTTNTALWEDGIARGTFIGNIGITRGDATLAGYFSGFSSFKTVVGRDVRYDSSVISPNISDLRLGINGATPSTISLPITINSTDVLKFEATYDVTTDAYFTLIGVKL